MTEQTKYKKFIIKCPYCETQNIVFEYFEKILPCDFCKKKFDWSEIIKLGENEK